MFNLSKIYTLLRTIAKSVRRDETILINQGRILAHLNEQSNSKILSKYEFKIFSQFGEDGIIQHLIQNLDIKNRTFIEFGVEDFQESNCRFLMMKDLWQGFVIDGSSKNLRTLRDSYFYWQYQLQSTCAFVTKDSVNSLLDSSGFDKNIGILSVDIDGVDYHVLNSLDNWNPSILIVEYNSVFGKSMAVSVPYKADFVRNEAHHSNQYWGASLAAFTKLANNRGMALVGVTSTGQNAFFVQRALLNDRISEVGVDECFTDMCFRDSRDESGKLTFLSGRDRKSQIKDLPLIDVVTGEELTVGELPDD